MTSTTDASQADFKQHPEDTEDLAASISAMLTNIQESFNTMSEQLLGKIDDLSKRVDDIEKNIGEIIGGLDGNE
uniref:Hypotheticial protein n=1 Tax=Schistosoma japonicum TaxID=6182 RepID=C1LGT8_SCHJA|nr:hypotheticial protein [Schistosoma japonicum]CAX73916.1 hypotheticial protein [Schistosoma japonicum]